MADRMLVLGAGGYIGRHVVKALLDDGHEVIGVVRPRSTALIDDRATIVEADLLAPGFDVTTLADRAPDGVIHLAWQDGFAHNAPSHILQLSSHFRLLEALVDWGVSRVAALGTMHEVGYWEGPINADTPTNPLSLYGIAKDALRRSVLASLAPRVPVQWLRCFYVYGDDRNNQSVFTRLLEAVDRGETTFPFTSGLNRYDFIEVGELARQIATVSTTPEIAGVINCASGVPVRLRDQVEAFIAEQRLQISLNYGAFPDRPYDSPAVWGDAAVIDEVMARARSNGRSA